MLFAGTLFWGETLTLLAKDAKPFAVIQIVFWAAGGLAALTLAATEYRQRRTPETLLLLLWTFGTFIFASFINWTVNGRSLLPMMPALAILLVRRLDQRTHSPGRVSSLLVVSAVFALLVAWSDYRFAQAVRHSAEQTSAQRGPSKPTLWFQGHWGYQFYLESPGAVALDLANSPLQVGDLLAVPLNNTNLRPPQQNAVALLTRLTVPKGTFLTTMDETLGASFYASVKGPLPFVFGKTPADQVLIFRFTTLPPAPPLTP